MEPRGGPHPNSCRRNARYPSPRAVREELGGTYSIYVDEKAPSFFRPEYQVAIIFGRILLEPTSCLGRSWRR